jgi:glycosyl transferase, family 25
MKRPFVINLDRRADRWLETSRCLVAAGIRGCQRFPAVDAQNLDLEELYQRGILSDSALRSANSTPTDYRDVTRGAVGCFLSHIALWQSLLILRRHNHQVIFEDDAAPTDVFRGLPQEERASVTYCAPIDWDIILLGGTPIVYQPTAHVDMLFRRVLYFYGVHAYIIKRSSIRKLLSSLTPIKTNFDHQLSDALMSSPGELKMYAVYPTWFEQAALGPSDIDVPFDYEAATERFIRYIRARISECREEGLVTISNR